ncbi:MAG: hypothetical protein JNK05_14985 [Myxococcales bacterium]|nr:hypothetical protein [Myxococcales bacterium]
MRSTKSLTIPLALAVSMSAAACDRTPAQDASVDSAASDSTVADSGELPCEPILDMTADVQPTYRCRDGRTCSPVRPEQADGGVYQVCPGTNGCATLVMYNGQSMVGFC